MKQIAIAVILLTGIFCAVLYTSCSKDACKGITCLNNAPCSGGMCTCPSGVGGNNCQTIYRLQYKGTYVGIGFKDTGSLTTESAIMVFNPTADSIYTNMTVVITDSSNHIVNVTLPITLSNITASGSAFTLKTSVINDTTTIISGTGNVSATSASLNLTIRDKVDTLYRTVSYNNFNRAH